MTDLTGIRRDVAAEFRRAIRPPWEVPTVVVANGALMIALWFLLPARAHDFLFSLSGPLAFPIILASWMLADTLATNVLGSDPAGGIEIVADRAPYWPWLIARCVVLGLFVGVPCAIAVMIVGAGTYPWVEIAWAGAIVLFLPVGVLPSSACLGILFPYHSRSLRWRWQRRRNWLMNLRWAVLVLAPLIYVPVIGMAILTPAVETARALKLPGQPLTPGQFGLAAAIACVTSLVAAGLGAVGAHRLLGRRRSRLEAYLSSSEVG